MFSCKYVLHHQKMQQFSCLELLDLLILGFDGVICVLQLFHHFWNSILYNLWPINYKTKSHDFRAGFTYGLISSTYFWIPKMLGHQQRPVRLETHQWSIQYWVLSNWWHLAIIQQFLGGSFLQLQPKDSICSVKNSKFPNHFSKLCSNLKHLEIWKFLNIFALVEINGSAPFSSRTEVNSLCPFLDASKIGVSFSFVTALISKFHVNIVSTGFISLRKRAFTI